MAAALRMRHNSRRPNQPYGCNLRLALIIVVCGVDEKGGWTPCTMPAAGEAEQWAALRRTIAKAAAARAAST
eukprot:1187192-Prorocentrum_minimum.AAC.2